MGLARRGRRLDEELATHTKMDDQALSMTIGCLEHQPEVLSPALGAMNHVAAQAICQIDRSGKMTSGDTPTNEQGLFDAAADNVVLKSPTNDLDLWKLRHPDGRRARPRPARPAQGHHSPGHLCQRWHRGRSLHRA